MANAHATHLGNIAKSASPLPLNPVLELLGQIVVLTEFAHGIKFERTGKVIGVVVALPSTRCASSILLEQGPDDCEFYDLDDVIICSAGSTTSLNISLGK